MGIEAILGGVVFLGLFGLWVVLPSKLRKNREQPKPRSPLGWAKNYSAVSSDQSPFVRMVPDRLPVRHISYTRGSHNSQSNPLTG